MTLVTDYGFALTNLITLLTEERIFDGRNWVRLFLEKIVHAYYLSNLTVIPPFIKFQFPLLMVFFYKSLNNYFTSILKGATGIFSLLNKFPICVLLKPYFTNAGSATFLL